MEKTNINRQLHEALGKHVCTESKSYPGTCRYCKEIMQIIPDYCADPRLVIAAMRERKDRADFYYQCLTEKDGYGGRDFRMELVLDTTGRLAKLALEWLKEKEDE